jgi:hypothetical protein
VCLTILFSVFCGLPYHRSDLSRKKLLQIIFLPWQRQTEAHNNILCVSVQSVMAFC